MKPYIFKFKNRSIPVTVVNDESAAIECLHKLFQTMEYNFDFRRRLSKITSIEMLGEIVVFKYCDGTKLYMEVC